MKKFIIKLLLLFTIITSLETQEIVAKNTSTGHLFQNEKSSELSSDVAWPKGPKEKSLSAESAIVMDANTGLILYEKNAHKVHYPASITKILTTLLAIENCSLNETVTFTESEVTGLEYGASNIGTMIGETLTIEQCLYAIMLSSANEVCLGVADYIAGDIPSFSDMMNERALALGCKNTHFSNPNGLHSDDHYTTAYDMALISKEALKSDTFRKVTGTKVAYIPKTNKYEPRVLPNHHNMLNTYTTSLYLYDGCIGGKTGYTSVAQSTLVTFAERDGMTLICVVMRAASPKTNTTCNQYTDTAALLNFGFENYQVHNLSSSTIETDYTESPLFTKFNSIFDVAHSPLQTSTNGQIILPVGVDASKAIQEVTFYENQNEDNGEYEIGNVSYSYGNKFVGSTNIYFNTEVSQNTLTSSADIEYTSSTVISKKGRNSATIIRRITIVVCVLFVVLFIIFYMKLLEKRRKISRRRYYSNMNKKNKKKDLHF